MSRRLLTCLLLSALTVAAVGGRPAPAAETSAGGKGLPNPFYAYCVGIGTGKENATLEAQLKLVPMLSELGYDGMAYVGLSGATEMLHALEQKGQKLLAVYTPLVVDAGDRGYDPQLKELIPQLKGHGTVIWLVVNSREHNPSSTDADGRAVELLREIADQAAQSGLDVSLYPHRGAYAERMEDVVRLAKKVDRPNVGVTFTLCHFMAVDDVKNLEGVLKIARPYLQMVTINGTSGYDPQNRAGWIQVLGDGTFDVTPVLRCLRKLDFQGPIGIIAYGIQGDRREILRRSIEAWKDLSARAAKP